MLPLFAEGSPNTDAAMIAAAITTAATLAFNAWQIWIRRQEKRDEHAKDIALSAQSNGIVQLKADMLVVQAETAECKRDREELKSENGELKSEVKDLKDMILGRYVGKKDPANLVSRIATLEAASEAHKPAEVRITVEPPKT